MAEHDDLYGILDSVLNDFRAVDGGASNPRVSEETKTLGQGLGLGLLALGPRKRRGVLAKAKSNGKTSSTSKEDKKSANGGHLSETLEELAQQTRQTLEDMETDDQEAMANKPTESIVKQFKELRSSKVLFKVYLHVLKAFCI
ncbi:hypothetical protein GOP47_0024056 [Adiantum capillus-veneris]|uniref:Uncharacterized protein n=1 Tax=Adiantum capillus-veneris TaxID=13818 RepID=A0A9D4U4Q8_ADICA|nr:hypothetical protein GOP47_0024056 [Adiantum capillus-veneris]